MYNSQFRLNMFKIKLFFLPNLHFLQCLSCWQLASCSPGCHDKNLMFSLIALSPSYLRNISIGTLFKTYASHCLPPTQLPSEPKSLPLLICIAAADFRLPAAPVHPRLLTSGTQSVLPRAVWVRLLKQIWWCPGHPCYPRLLPHLSLFLSLIVPLTDLKMFVYLRPLMCTSLKCLELYFIQVSYLNIALLQKPPLPLK